jgi:hypothetical protein
MGQFRTIMGGSGGLGARRGTQWAFNSSTRRRAEWAGRKRVSSTSSISRSVTAPVASVRYEIAAVRLTAQHRCSIDVEDAVVAQNQWTTPIGERSTTTI